MRRQASTTSALVRCQLPPGGSIAVAIGDHSRTFVAGDTVALDDLAAPGLTWREALGSHVEAFAPVLSEAPSVPQE